MSNHNHEACAEKSVDQQHEKHANHYIDVTTLIARNSILHGNKSHAARKAMLHPPIEIVDKSANNPTPKESAEYVAREVDAQIETCPAVDERPHDKDCGQQTATNEEAEENGNAERVTGMSREEAVTPTPIAIDNIDMPADDWIMGRSPACHERFDDTVVHSSGKQIAKGGTANDEENL